jgi:NlpE N-terminal domain
MPTRSKTTLLALVWVLHGCGPSTEHDAGAVHPPPPHLAGVYAGELPCSNCVGIEATLWLRPDGAFFLRQTLRDEAQTAPAPTDRIYAPGRWHWDEHGAQLVLHGAGPERRLVALDDERLKLLMPSPAEHVLTRDAADPPFTDRLELDGESAVGKTGAVFRECLTGLTFDVADAGALKELRRQHRVMNPRGKVALTSVIARLRPGASGDALVVERVIALKPGTGC